MTKRKKQSKYGPKRLAVVRGEGMHDEEYAVVMCDSRGPMMVDTSSYFSEGSWSYDGCPLYEFCQDEFKIATGFTLKPGEWCWLDVKGVDPK